MKTQDKTVAGLSISKREIIISLFWLIVYAVSQLSKTMEVETEASKFVTQQGNKETRKQENKKSSVRATNIASTVSATETKTPVLRYPFRIVQAGPKRSASTFQWWLLSRIALLKTPPGSRTENFHVIREFDNFADELSSVWKTHDISLLPSLANRGAAIFTSNYKSDLSLHNQWKDNFHVCSLCEVDHYKDIFDLSNEEIALLREHMKYWEIIRRCCSDKSSKYHIAAVHGCDMTPYLQLPEYPMCEHYNMTYIELKYCDSPLSGCYNNTDPEKETHWRGLGDCARIDNLMVEKSLGFESNPFQGCDNLQDRLVG